MACGTPMSVTSCPWIAYRSTGDDDTDDVFGSHCTTQCASACGVSTGTTHRKTLSRHSAEMRPVALCSPHATGGRGLGRLVAGHTTGATGFVAPGGAAPGCRPPPPHVYARDAGCRPRNLTFLGVSKRGFPRTAACRGETGVAAGRTGTRVAAAPFTCMTQFTCAIGRPSAMPMAPMVSASNVTRRQAAVTVESSDFPSSISADNSLPVGTPGRWGRGGRSAPRRPR